MERVGGIEPPSSAWKAEIIAIIRYPPTLSLRRASPQVIVDDNFLVGPLGIEPRTPSLKGWRSNQLS
jgi:hypothetical protein